MIANLLNTLVGIGLVYFAVLATDRIASNAWGLLIAGIVVVLAAVWSRSSGRVRWMSVVNAFMGLGLIALAGAHAWITLPRLALFWGVFWLGCVLAVVALWAALYRPDYSPTEAGVELPVPASGQDPT